MSQTLTLTELARFDGKEGRPAYVAVDGVIHDLSTSPFWANGEHRLCDLGARAGRDLSDEIKYAPSFMRSMLAAMPVVGTLAPIGRRGGGITRAALVGLFVVALALPFIAMGVAGFRSDAGAWVALRLAAMEAFTLLFVDIVVGAYRPLLTEVFRTKAVHRAHQWIGVAAFALAVGHGSTVLSLGIKGYLGAAVWIGPAMLGVLAVIIAVAFLRRRASRVWRWIHRVNYVLFAAALTHASYLGFNVRTQTFLKVVFYVYAAAVAAGLSYRIYLLVKREASPAQA